MLRQFLYLDVELTEQFLSQVEGGIYDEESVSARSQYGRGAGGRLGVAGMGLEAGGSKSAEDLAARTVRQTPESRFDRLVTGLEGSDEVLTVDSTDQAAALRRGQVFEADVTLGMPVLIRLLLLAQSFGPTMQLLERGGLAAPMDSDAVAAMSGLVALGQVIQTLPVVGSVSGADEFRMVMQLKPAFVRMATDELDGEATVLAKVRRVFPAGETHNVVQIVAGQGTLPPEIRESFEKSLRDNEGMQDMFVSGPGALVTPVAIYR